MSISDVEGGIAIGSVRIVIRRIRVARAGGAGPIIVLGRTARRCGNRVRSQHGNGLIAVVESEELQSARACVGNFENGVGGQLILQTEMPLLGVGRDQMRIERVKLRRIRVG